jgi:hypothetical protein
MTGSRREIRVIGQVGPVEASAPQISEAVRNALAVRDRVLSASADARAAYMAKRR